MGGKSVAGINYTLMEKQTGPGDSLNVEDEKDRGVKGDIQICFVPLMPSAEKRNTAELTVRNKMMRHSYGDIL